MRRKIKVTSIAQQQLKEIAGRFISGEITQCDAYEALREALKPITANIIQSVSRRYDGFLDVDDIKATVDEAIWHIVTHLKPEHGLTLRYVRKVINGKLKSLARQLAFISKVPLNCPVPQRVSLTVLEELEESEEDHLDILVDRKSEHEFTEIELRNWMERKLQRSDYEVFRLLAEGYGRKEICERLNLTHSQLANSLSNIAMELARFRAANY